MSRQGPIRKAYKGVTLVSSPECLKDSYQLDDGPDQ